MSRTVLTTPSAIDAMTVHSRGQHPRECCGILLGRFTPQSIEIHHALPTRNLAEPARRHDRYTVDPAAILRADHITRDSSLDIVGFYHSHPNHPASASTTDAELAWEGYIYVILSTTAEVVTEIRAWEKRPDLPVMQELPLQAIRPDPLTPA